MENTSLEVEELEGCMCQYVPTDLRSQIEAIAEKCEAYTSQVVALALQVGLGVLARDALSYADEFKGLKGKPGKIAQKKFRRGKLSGAGI